MRGDFSTRDGGMPLCTQLPWGCSKTRAKSTGEPSDFSSDTGRVMLESPDTNKL